MRERERVRERDRESERERERERKREIVSERERERERKKQEVFYIYKLIDAEVEEDKTIERVRCSTLPENMIAIDVAINRLHRI